MCINSRLRMVWAKSEVTPGTDAVPTIADAIFVMEDSPPAQEQAQTLNVTGATATLGQRALVLTGQRPTATLRIPIAGLGRDDGKIVVPKWASVILQTVSLLSFNSAEDELDITIASEALSRVGTGDATSEARTFTLYDFYGRVGTGDDTESRTELIKLLGCRVVSYEINNTIGEILTLEVQIQAQSFARTSPVDIDFTGSAPIDYTGFSNQFIPATLFGSTFRDSSQTPTLPGATSQAILASAVTISVDLAGEQVEGDGAASGVACVETREATVTGTLNPIVPTGAAAAAVLASVRAPNTRWELRSALMTPPGRTASTGYSAQILLPSCQSATAEIDRDGSAMRDSISFVANEPLLTIRLR